MPGEREGSGNRWLEGPPADASPPARGPGRGSRPRGRRPPAGRLRRTAPPGPLPHCARHGPTPSFWSDRPIATSTGRYRISATSDGSRRGGGPSFLGFPKYPAGTRPVPPSRADRRQEPAPTFGDRNLPGPGSGRTRTGRSIRPFDRPPPRPWGRTLGSRDAGVKGRWGQV